MKTTKNTPSTRRSLRHTANGSKSEKSINVKTTADQSKQSAKTKTKGGKTIQKSSAPKAANPVPKRKRETEEDSEEVPVEAASGDTEELSKTASNSDQDESSVKPKVKRSRKKKDNHQGEELKWRTLDDFGEGIIPDKTKKKSDNAAKGGDRRKQSLVERDIPCAVMVQTVLKATSDRKGDDSDCEVLDGANSVVDGSAVKQGRKKTGPNEDLDDAQSEAGSNFCEIIEEGSSALDFKKLFALARRVSLPSSIWACHLDPLSHFVSFSRFNPDFSEDGSNLVDRAVVFKGSMKPFVFCNGEVSSLPEEINSFETLTDVAHALQHLNATILP